MKYWYSFALLLIIACSRNPYAKTNKQYKKQAKAFARTLARTPLQDSITSAGPWIGTINFNLRKPNFVVIHHTAQNSCDQTFKTFTVERTQVSAHYVICRDGTVHHMLNDYLRAWHGGLAKWGNVTDVNSSSIGIELDNSGNEPFSEMQINSLIRLLQNLKTAYAIPTANFIGHADIAPVRKNDPSYLFPWKSLADKGFGYWYNDTATAHFSPSFNYIDALRQIGYDIKDTSAAFHAYRIHFLQDTLGSMDEPAKKILFSLYKKYQ